jgi:hypothetical protein
MRATALAKAPCRASAKSRSLPHGVAVDVLSLGDAPTDSQVIVAWIEQGEADLEFDGAEARPSESAWFGSSESRELGSARVVLKARA